MTARSSSRADDSVMRVVDGAPAYLRRARGFVPEPIDLGADGPSVIAVGARSQEHDHGHARARGVRLAAYRRSRRSRDRSASATRRSAICTSILDVEPEVAACDLHPDFVSTRSAEESGLAGRRASSITSRMSRRSRPSTAGADRCSASRSTATGYGDDGAPWGGELIVLDGARWRAARLARAARAAGRRPRRARALAHGRRDARIGSGGSTRRRGSSPARRRRAELADAFRARRALRRDDEPRPPVRRRGGAARRLPATSATKDRRRWSSKRWSRRRARSPAAGASTDGRLDLAPLLWRIAERAARCAATAAEAVPRHADRRARRLDRRRRRARSGLERVALGGGCMMNRVLAEGLMRRAARARPRSRCCRARFRANDGGAVARTGRVRARADRAPATLDGGLNDVSCDSRAR